LSRRHLLAAAGAAPFAGLAFGAALREDSPRIVLVILRGGMDGLSAVPAPGDPAFAAARGPLAAGAADALALDGTFALHPNLLQLHAMYLRGEAAIVHAVGLPYRERSHFDAQQVLESGGTRPYELSTGWLGRALAASRRRGVAINTAVPLVLRGADQVDTWAPSVLPDPSPDLVARLQAMYREDAALARALERARDLRANPEMAQAVGTGATGPGRNAFVELARKAGEMLLRQAQVAVLELGGWDTHANQTAPFGALANNLRTLDAALAALREALAAPRAGPPAWAHTVVIVATEFGREVAGNGTAGTDHGSGGAAFVLGGAVRGGRVLADWPGLAREQRFEGRDLKTTTDLRGILKPALAEHLGVSRGALERDVLPGSAAVKALDLLA
jgi:uncharacterized protein (DUF1501 family)